MNCELRLVNFRETLSKALSPQLSGYRKSENLQMSPLMSLVATQLLCNSYLTEPLYKAQSNHGLWGTFSFWLISFSCLPVTWSGGQSSLPPSGFSVIGAKSLEILDLSSNQKCWFLSF